MEHHLPLINLDLFGIPMPVTFQWIAMILIALFCYFGTSQMKLIPEGIQNIVEYLYTALRDFFIGIIGEHHGPHFAPFCIALWIYIFTMNILGIVPGFKSATEVFSNNLALGIMVFSYLHFSAIQHHGVKGYFLHLAGSPHDMVGYIMSPLMFVLHVVGELVRPFSLSLRLFGNIYGEEMVIGVFFSLVPLFIPVPFLLLACLTSLIQATVFSMLTAVYFSLSLADHH